MNPSKIQNLKSKNTRVAIDTGGTFTDFFIITKEGIRTHKIPSTPQDPSLAIERGLHELGLKENFELIHGSTVATNALLERKGAETGLITTAGFEDLLEIGRQNRPQLYALSPDRPPALVKASFRVGVAERIDAQGKILKKLDSKTLRELKKKIRKSKVKSWAVCLLFSYLNPSHERKIERALKRLGIALSLSAEICPEYREYERLATTCVNAYVLPIMSEYLRRLRRRIPQKIRIMQSNGGSLSVNEAIRHAVRTLLSGPAGGALGALRVAKRSGFDRLLTLDIGGTSTDLALIDEDLEITSEAEVGFLPVKTPMIRIHTLGAGGGSIARSDAGGALRVGPLSAGSSPGPLCYGRSGKHLTLTDAHVWLGRIPARHFLGGTMPLYPEKIERALGELSRKMKMSPSQTAEGIIQVANSNITRGMRVITLERGIDPRNFTLTAFGGAGPLHACELAEALEMSRVLVPHDPGILSAYGMAYADWVRDYVQTILVKGRKAGFSSLKKLFLALEKKALEEGEKEGFSSSEIKLLRYLDLRYEGQSYELTVDFSPRFRSLFEGLHLKRFGYLHEGRLLDVVNLRLKARVALKMKESFPRSEKIKKASLPAPEEIRSILWKQRAWKTPVVSRSKFIQGARFRGPLIISEYSATTFVPPGWKGFCDPEGNLVMEKN